MKQAGDRRGQADWEGRADQLVDRISALETKVNCLILLVERIAKSVGLRS